MGRLELKSAESTAAGARPALRVLRRVSASRLPPDLRGYFQDLKRSYRLETANAPGAVPDVARELLAIAEDDATWSDIFALEKAYSAVLPDAEIPGHFASCRERLRQIVGADAYAAYLQTKPQDPADASADIPRMRADLMALLDRLNYLYTATPAKERIRNRLSFWLSVITVVAAAMISNQLRIALRTPDSKYTPHTSHTLLLAVFAGLLGGFISVQARLQSKSDVDPLFNRFEMSSGFWNIILVAPISGAIFAVILYGMFAAGVVSGSVFPSIYTGPSGSSPTTYAMDLHTFLATAGPATGVDLAKVIVWSFIAGFAERFVPDVLTRLSTVDTSRTQKS